MLTWQRTLSRSSRRNHPASFVTVLLAAVLSIASMGAHSHGDRVVSGQVLLRHRRATSLGAHGVPPFTFTVDDD